MKKIRNLLLAAAFFLIASGCGETQTPAKGSYPVEETELKEQFIPAEESGDVPTIIMEYGETEDNPHLAAFLASYYRIPEPSWKDTRYYYNYIDLNEDGTDEIFAVVLSDELTDAKGDPALIVASDGDRAFSVLKEFEHVRTPVTIRNNMTNGWHDIVLKVYGMGTETGYQIYRYGVEEGYTPDGEDPIEKLEPASGTQILSDNFIDDMDKGNYLTLESAEEKE